VIDFRKKKQFNEASNYKYVNIVCRSLPNTLEAAM